jgi:lipooligosaccharide transport system permease protein
MPAASLRGTVRVWKKEASVWRYYAGVDTLFKFGQPVMMLLSFGFALGTYVSLGRPGGYLAFVAPGLLAIAVMNGVTFDALFGTWWKLHESRAYEAVVTTPVSPGEIVAGNVLWQATQSLVYGLVFTALLVVLGLTHSPWIALVPLLAVAGAPLFGLPAMAWGAWAGGFGRINLFYYTEAVVAPMFFFSGAFFPVGSLPAYLQAAIWVMPLYHVVNISRALADGSLHGVLLVDIAYCLCLTAVFAALVVRLFRRQLTT